MQEKSYHRAREMYCTWIKLIPTTRGGSEGIPLEGFIFGFPIRHSGSSNSTNEYYIHCMYNGHSHEFR